MKDEDSSANKDALQALERYGWGNKRRTNFAKGGDGRKKSSAKDKDESLGEDGTVRANALERGNKGRGWKKRERKSDGER